MKERPILFNGDMVRAILDGRKTQARRILKPQPSCGYGWYPGCGDDGKSLHYANESHWRKGAAVDWRPYGQPGDRLWVRETYYLVRAQSDPDGRVIEVDYKADPNHTKRMCPQKWRPSIHMPRWASRITLEVTDVRVERLQDISEADAVNEGVEPYHMGYRSYDGPGWYASAINSFDSLWQSINGPDSWGANPWVWVIEFKRIEND